MEEQVKIKILVKASNVIIVRSGDILLINARERNCQERKMKLNPHMMRVLIPIM